MKKINLKEILIPIIVLTVICLISGAALSITNEATAEKIAANEQQKTDEAMMTVMPCEHFEQIGDTDLYAASSGDKVVGYAAGQTAVGYGGDVTVMVGIKLDGSINKIEIVSCDDETPGLGQNIKTDDFKSRFNGLSGKLTIGEDVDGWSGATISSTAVCNAVNAALELYSENIMEVQ